MDARIAIWNTLHDGEITVVALEGDTLVVFVSIPYIRERIPPLGDSFVLRLAGFRSVELADVEGRKKSSDFADLSKSGIEILSCDSKAMPVKIATTTGFLTLDFESVEIATDTGRVLAYSEVDRACSDFWEEWSAKAKEAQKNA
jgi:hypothetical protein